MSTSHSPDRVLRSQATKIASILKSAEKKDWRGVSVKGPVPNTAREQPSIKVGVAMDDKLVQIDIAWTVIRDTSNEALIEYILTLMRGQRADA